MALTAALNHVLLFAREKCWNRRAARTRRNLVGSRPSLVEQHRAKGAVVFIQLRRDVFYTPLLPAVLPWAINQQVLAVSSLHLR